MLVEKETWGGIRARKKKEKKIKSYTRRRTRKNQKSKE
jgi:hypothetical protein